MLRATVPQGSFKVWQLRPGLVRHRSLARETNANSASRSLPTPRLKWCILAITTQASGSRRWHLSTRIEKARSKYDWRRRETFLSVGSVPCCSPSSRQAMASPFVHRTSAVVESLGVDQATVRITRSRWLSGAIGATLATVVGVRDAVASVAEPAELLGAMGCVVACVLAVVTPMGVVVLVVGEATTSLAGFWFRYGFAESATAKPIPATPPKNPAAMRKRESDRIGIACASWHSSRFGTRQKSDKTTEGVLFRCENVVSRTRNAQRAHGYPDGAANITVLAQNICK